MRAAGLVLAVGAVLLGNAARAAPPVWHRSVSFDYTVAADGTATATETWDVTADTAAIAQVVAEQTYAYQADLEQVTLVEAATRKRDGRALPVEADAVFAKAVTTTASAPQFSDTVARTVVFPQVGAGDTVHYVLRRVGLATTFPGQFTATLEAGSASTTDRADITIRTASGQVLRSDAAGLDALPPERAPDGEVLWRWRRAPSASGRVVLEVSTLPDYAAVGRIYAARAFPAAAPTPAIRALADRVAPDGLDARETLRRLTGAVAQQVRYVALFLGEGRVVPRDAAAVLASGWGDCKDHAALLQALLAAKGIAALPALISLQNRYDLPDAPGLGALDHVIVYVPSLDLYVDPTSPYAPAGLLPAAEYDKPVVIADPAAARLARTPPMPAPGLVLETTTRARIAEDGTVSGRTETRAAGLESVSLRAMAAWFERNGPGYAAALQLDRLGTPGTATYSFDTPDTTAEGYGVTGRFMLEDRLEAGSAVPFALPAGLPVFGRTGSVLLGAGFSDGGVACFPGRETEDLTLELPGGAHLATLPSDIGIDAGPARFSATYREAEGRLLVHRELTVAVARQRCTPAEAAAMRPAFAAARRGQWQPVTLIRPIPDRLAATP